MGKTKVTTNKQNEKMIILAIDQGKINKGHNVI